MKLDGVSRILVIRLDKVGDLILSTPFFRNLSLLFPDASVTAAVTPYACGVLENNPFIRETVVVPDDAAGRVGAAAALRGRRFDLAFSLSPVTAAYRLAAQSGAAYRLGYVYRGRLLTQLYARLVLSRCYTLDVQGMLRRGLAVTHEVRQTFSLLEFLGLEARDFPLELYPRQSDRRRAEEILAPGACGKYIGVQLSPKWLNAPWSRDDLRNLIGALADTFGDYGFLLLYGKGEEEIARPLGEAFSSGRFVFAGDTSVLEWASLMERCDAFVTTDTGSLHCAAAMQVPVAAVYEKDTFLHCSSQWAPWMVPNRVIEKKEFRKTAEHIVKSVEALLS